MPFDSVFGSAPKAGVTPFPLAFFNCLCCGQQPRLSEQLKYLFLFFLLIPKICNREISSEDLTFVATGEKSVGRQYVQKCTKSCKFSPNSGLTCQIFPFFSHCLFKESPVRPYRETACVVERSQQLRTMQPLARSLLSPSKITRCPCWCFWQQSPIRSLCCRVYSPQRKEKQRLGSKPLRASVVSLLDGAALLLAFLTRNMNCPRQIQLVRTPWREGLSSVPCQCLLSQV